MAIYFGTLCCEVNRWTPDKIPTIKASEFIPRALEAGFEGVELWQFHYTHADAEEKKRLAEMDCVDVFSSYVNFDDGLTDDVLEVADAIKAVNAKAVKFNFSGLDTLEKQLENLKAFKALLKPGTKMYCECHANTLMEVPEKAKEVFEILDDDYKAIIHMGAGKEDLEKIYKQYGEKITHVHMQFWDWDFDGYVPLSEKQDILIGGFEVMKENGFDGTYAIEFTSGNNAEDMFRSACNDLKWMRENGMK